MIITGLDKKEIVLTEVQDKREFFYVVLKFDSPYEGTITVAARDEAHARELVMAQFDERKNLKIIDVFSESQLPEFPGLEEDVTDVEFIPINKNVN